MKIDRVLLGAVSALGLTFVLSIALYFLVPGNLTRVVLAFPDELSGKIVPEVRFLPWNWDSEHNAELLVKEILLGPARHTNQRLFSRQAQVKSVLVRGSTIYVDLENDSFIPDADVLYSPQESLDVLEKTIMDNIKTATTVRISIEGQLPFKKSR